VTGFPFVPAACPIRRSNRRTHSHSRIAGRQDNDHDTDLDAGEFSVQLVAALAMLANTMGKDLAEADWWRLLDALLLIAAHPAVP
jgi:hypothetical protein